uniref:Uncharacterized protein n=1 Tax=viral metagenome TaxID=1070528 RepID=A0A6M3JAG5_9ZZZZ
METAQEIIEAKTILYTSDENNRLTEVFKGEFAEAIELLETHPTEYLLGFEGCEQIF